METEQKRLVGSPSLAFARLVLDWEEEKEADPARAAETSAPVCSLSPRSSPSACSLGGPNEERGNGPQPETSPLRGDGLNGGEDSVPPCHAVRSSVSRSSSRESAFPSLPLAAAQQSFASCSSRASSPALGRDGYMALHAPQAEQDELAPASTDQMLPVNVSVEPGEDATAPLLPSPSADATSSGGCPLSRSVHSAGERNRESSLSGLLHFPFSSVDARRREGNDARTEKKRRRRTEFAFSASAPFSLRRSLDEGKAFLRSSPFFSRKGGGREEEHDAGTAFLRAGSFDLGALSRRDDKNVSSGGPPESPDSQPWGAEERLVSEGSQVETFCFALTQNSQPRGQADVQNAVLYSPIFALLDADEKRQILELLTSSMIHVACDCILFHRGEKVDVLYFLENGELEMAAVGQDAEIHPEESNVQRRRGSAGGSSQDPREAEPTLDRLSSPPSSPVQIPSGAFVLPRAFVRAGRTEYRVRAVKPSALYKLTAQSFQSVANGAVLRRASDLLAYMLRCPILEALTKREASQLVPLMRWQQFLPNEVILHQNQISWALLIVMKGKARGVRRLARHGRPETLEYYEEGSCINFLCLLQDFPNSTSVIAEGPEGCIVASLSRSSFEGLMGKAERLLDRGHETADGGKGYTGRIDLGEVKKTWSKVLKMAGPR